MFLATGYITLCQPTACLVSFPDQFTESRSQIPLSDKEEGYIRRHRLHCLGLLHKLEVTNEIDVKVWRNTAHIQGSSTSISPRFWGCITRPFFSWEVGSRQKIKPLAAVLHRQFPISSKSWSLVGKSNPAIWLVRKSGFACESSRNVWNLDCID